MRKAKARKLPAWTSLNHMRERMKSLVGLNTYQNQRELRAHEHPKEPERNKK
jgi:uncharacterized short protein YbdD (DUF466 family)